MAAETAAGSLTDPAEAAALVARTGAVCLAVSIGNVHGAYSRPPELDWPRLDAVRAAVPGRLSLHGASGLASGDLSQAVGLGVAKVNVNTELRERYLSETSARLDPVSAGANLLALNRALAEATAELVVANLDELAVD